MSLNKLRKLLRQLKKSPEEEALWEQALELLLADQVPEEEVEAIVLEQDLDGLEALCHRLSQADPEKAKARQALQAFKKRWKLMILDDESKIGGGPFSSGRDTSIAGIQPPNGFSEEIWQKLASEGRLKAMGDGTYRLL
ncbi:MAG: hypothetical protein DWQ01_01375 [Planctomycetota bacterium]|nr:MAG: hypothetical protein DWQ01_01375 [Planctomycetota bacterium]